MEENKNINKAAKSAFDNFRMDPPDAAWDKIETELDRKQSGIYKRKADRFKYISVALALFLLCIIGWNFFKNPDTTVLENSKNDLTVNNDISNNKESSSKTNNSISGQQKLNNQDYITSNNQESKSLVENNSNKNSSSDIPEGYQQKTDTKILISETGNTSVNTLNYENYSQKQHASDKGFVFIDLIASIEPDIVQNVSAGQPVPAADNDTLVLVTPVKQSKWSLGFYFTPEYKWQYMKDKTNNNFDDVSMYNSREKCMFSYSLGIITNYQLNGQWSLTSGINYSKFSKDITVPVMYAKMNDNNEMYFEYNTSVGNIDVPLDPSHSYMNPGDSIVTKTDCNYLIKSISVPLLVRYTVENNRLSYYFEGGVHAGYIVQSKADFSYDGYHPTVINNTSGLQDFNLEFSAGIGVQYGISSRTKLFTEPVFKGSLTSLTKNIAVNSYPYSLGLKLGVVKKF